MGAATTARALRILYQPKSQTTSRIKHCTVDTELVEKLQPARCRSLRIFAGDTSPAVPAIERREVGIGFETGCLAVAPSKVIMKFSVFFQNMSVRVNNRIIYVHKISGFNQPQRTQRSHRKSFLRPLRSLR